MLQINNTKYVFLIKNSELILQLNIYSRSFTNNNNGSLICELFVVSTYVTLFTTAYRVNMISEVFDLYNYIMMCYNYM